MKTKLRMTAVAINNIIVFLSCVIPRRIPVYRWPEAWRHVTRSHEREVREMLTELTMSGEIKRRIVDGEFVYYPMEQENETE